jgi:hypothetical protein
MLLRKGLPNSFHKAKPLIPLNYDEIIDTATSQQLLYDRLEESGTLNHEISSIRDGVGFMIVIHDKH